MTGLPTRHTLQVQRYSAGAVDAHGNTAPSWSEPVDWPVTALAPGANVEPGEPNRDLSRIEWTVYAPKSERVPTERDRVLIDGKLYEVDGCPADYTNPPWSDTWTGVTVQLRRSEG